MKYLMIASFLMLCILLSSGCKKDTPDLPMSELILGQWKWLNQGLKIVSPDGETLMVTSQNNPAGAFIDLQAPDLAKTSIDGGIIVQGTWELDEVNKKIFIVDTNFSIFRLDKEYLILGYDLVDPGSQEVSRYTFIFKR